MLDINQLLEKQQRSSVLPDDDRQILAGLLDFIDLEQDTQNKRIQDLWEKSVAERVAEGEAIHNITVVGFDKYGNALLKCPINVSKFRILDALRLSRGNPQSGPVFPCTLFRDNGDELIVKPGYNSSFHGLKPGPGWVLDRGVVDVRWLQKEAIRELGGSPKVLDYLLGILRGTIESDYNLRAAEQTSRQAQSQWGFNPSQAEAFARAYHTNNYYVIQGPPGTGKTRVLAQLAAELARQGQLVMVTSFTHRAINNALRKIAQDTSFPNVFKVGDPQRAVDLKWDSGQVHNIERFDTLKYADDLIDSREEGLIIGATCFAPRTRRLRGINFDTIIFDEAGQVTLPIAIMAMLAGNRFVFIGDHKQMAPVIVAEHKDEWVTASVFETAFRHSPGTMLDTTYRMNEEINQFPSQRFYNGKLRCAPSAAGRQFQLPKPPSRFQTALSTEHASIFINVPHQRNGMRSEEEAAVVADLVAEALRCGLPPSEMAVISPYRAQGRLIRTTLQKMDIDLPKEEIARIVVDTVERIQGQERQMIIISLATSDPAHASARADFYFQPNRLNVSITRPKTKRIIVGSPFLLTAQPESGKHQRWVSHFRALYESCVKVDVNGLSLGAASTETDQ